MKEGPRLDRGREQDGEPTREDVNRGRLAAVVIFAFASLAQIAIFLSAKRSPNSEAVLNVMLLDMTMAFVGPVFAILVGMSLPKRSRGAFWSTGVLCIFLTFLLWGVTCSML